MGGGNDCDKRILDGGCGWCKLRNFLAPDSGENTRRKVRQRGERLFRDGFDAVLQSNQSRSDSESQSGNAATGTTGLELKTDQSVTEPSNSTIWAVSRHRYLPLSLLPAGRGSPLGAQAL